MNESPKQKRKLWWRLAAWIWLTLFTGIVLVNIIKFPQAPWGWVLSESATGASLGTSLLGLWWFIRWLQCWRHVRWTLVGLAVLATLLTIFYTEENWRGKRAWENCKRELEAKGVVLDWDKYIPPPVPDDQNFFKATKNITPWFVKARTEAEDELAKNVSFFHGVPYNTNTTATITNEPVARDYLAWSDQFQSNFDELREALKRPYARIDGDYSRPFESPIPNFVTMRSVAQTLAQRTKCYLLLGQPEKALHELTLLNDSRRIVEGRPTSRPMTLVASMINVAITGLYADTIACGLQSHSWHEQQMIAIQEQLSAIDLSPFVAESFREEPVASSRYLEVATPAALAEMLSHRVPKNLWQKLTDPNYALVKFLPRGWVYQNMAFVVTMGQKWNVGFGLTNKLILPGEVDRTMKEVTAELAHWSPWNIWSRISIPNFTKAIQNTAKNQTLVNQAQIACALERYHLAHGEYPEMLDALVPQFMEKLPHDIIGGEPLHYRRTDDGKFLLYSIGWNETDDRGVTVKDKSGNEDKTQGDWVWQYRAK